MEPTKLITMNVTDQKIEGTENIMINNHQDDHSKKQQYKQIYIDSMD